MGYQVSDAAQSNEVATTGSDVVSNSHPSIRPPTAPPRGPYLKNRPGQIVQLTPKHRLIIEYMTHGAPGHIASLVKREWTDDTGTFHSEPVKAGVPLSLEEACDCLGIRRRHGRHLFAQKAFQTELAKAVESLREGAKLGALRKVVELVHEPGEGKAADRKVQLQAAQAILGDQIGQDAKQPAVQVNVGLSLQPGIVVRLPSDLPQTPLDITPANVTDTPRE